MALTGLDPTADEILGELSEAATGVIELVSLGMTARKKSLIQRNGSSGLGCNQRIDCGGDLFKPAHERKALTVANECSGAKGGLDLPLDWICLAAWLSLHPAFASLDPFQPVWHNARICRIDRPRIRPK
jgi:hypothetical protein